MGRLRKFVSLSAIDRRLLIEAACFLGVIRILLRLLAFPTLWRLLNSARWSSFGLAASNRSSLDRITWAITVTSPYMLGVRPCLPQALAAQLLLVRRGFPARLHLGVAKGDLGQVRAHAWIETDGKIVTGGSQPELERYKALLALDAQTR